MDTNEIKSHLSKYFDRSSSPSGIAQYFHGEYFSPKEMSSLRCFIDLITDTGSHEAELTRKKLEIENLLEEAKSLALDAEMKIGEASEKLSEL